MIQPKLNVDHSQKPKSFEAFVSSSKWNKKCKRSQFVLRHRLQELCIYKHKTTFGNNPNQFGWELTAFRCCSAYLPTWVCYIFCTGFCNTSLYHSVQMDAEKPPAPNPHAHFGGLGKVWERDLKPSKQVLARPNIHCGCILCQPISSRISKWRCCELCKLNMSNVQITKWCESVTADKSNVTCDQAPLPPNKKGGRGRGAWLQVKCESPTLLGEEVKASVHPTPQGNTSWWIWDSEQTPTN